MSRFHYGAGVMAAIFLALTYVAPVSAQTKVTEKCNNDTEGRRKAIRCTFTQPEMGMVWKGSASRARKLYVSKPAGDTGQEIVRLWIDGRHRGDFLISPGAKRHIFLKKGESTIVARAEVQTVKLPASGPSTISVHFETLDRPKMPDLSQCSNTATADRQSVCWPGNF